MLIGAHVSTSGGPSKAIGRGENISAECVQIFASSPRAWKSLPIPDYESNLFKSEIERAAFGPTVLHGKYLCALGSSDSSLVERSIDALVKDLQASETLGALGVIFHPASHRGQGYESIFSQFVDCVLKILELAPGNSLLMLENSAGSGDHIGSNFLELGKIIKSVNSERLAVCLDTQHAFAAGYNVATKEGLLETIKEFDGEIGIDRLRAVHANDSKRELGAAVDRHENIGDGFIGKTGFENILSDPVFNNVPFYLEVPGYEKKGPDLRNVKTLISIRESVH